MSVFQQVRDRYNAAKKAISGFTQRNVYNALTKPAVKQVIKQPFILKQAISKNPYISPKSLAIKAVDTQYKITKDVPRYVKNVITSPSVKRMQQTVNSGVELGRTIGKTINQVGDAFNKDVKRQYEYSQTYKKPLYGYGAARIENAQNRDRFIQQNIIPTLQKKLPFAAGPAQAISSYFKPAPEEIKAAQAFRNLRTLTPQQSEILDRYSTDIGLALGGVKATGNINKLNQIIRTTTKTHAYKKAALDLADDPQTQTLIQKALKQSSNRKDFIKQLRNMKAGNVPSTKPNFSSITLDRNGNVIPKTSKQQLRGILEPRGTVFDDTESVVQKEGRIIQERLKKGAPSTQGYKNQSRQSFLRSIEPTDPYDTTKIPRPTTLKEKLMYDFNNTFHPEKNMPTEAQDILQTWRNAHLSGKTKANVYVQQFSYIPEKEGPALIHYIQNPTEENLKKINMNPKKAQKTALEIRKALDTLRAEGIRRGLDVGYLDNYLNQVWKETPEQVTEKMRAANINPSFSKQRVLPSYQAGINLGLTPKYSHPGQLVAHYYHSLEKATANKYLLDALYERGLIQEAAPDTTWRPITAPYVQELNGKFAPKEVADVLTNIFEPRKTTKMGYVAKLSRLMQEIKLSGGYRQINAFTFAQMQKEFLAGRFKSPLGAFVRSWSDDASRQYFQQNQKYVTEMAEQGISLQTNLDYDTAYKNMFLKDKTLSQVVSKLGGTWDDTFQAPTFRRMLPQLEIQIYKDARMSGLSAKQAAETVKAFYGLSDNFARSYKVEEGLGAALFAPKFRENIIGYWINTIKSVLPQNIQNPAYRYNRRFLVGSLITYTLYSALNKKLSGHWMHENKSSKKLSLEIPVGNGRSEYIPFLPSIGTVPRRGLEMAGALVEGDVRTATQKASSFLSMPIQLGIGQIAANRTYYGAPITSESDSGLKRYGKLAGYAFSQTVHPYLGEFLEYRSGRKTPLEALAGAFELSIYPGSSTGYENMSQKQKIQINYLQQQGASEQEAINYVMQDRFKADALAAFLDGDREKAGEIQKKYNIEITQKDLQDALKDRVLVEISEGNVDQALELSQTYNITLTRDDMKALALELYFQGEVEKAAYIQKAFQLQIYQKDIIQ